MQVKKYSTESLQYMNIFRRVTNTLPKDYFEVNSELVFVVNRAEVGAALGKGGANIRKLKELLNKKIKVVGSGKDVKELVANFLYPIKTKNISTDNSLIELELNQSSDRRTLLRNSQCQLKLLKNVVKRYFPEVAEIKVL